MIMAAVLKIAWHVTIGTSLKQIGFAVSYTKATISCPTRGRPADLRCLL